MFEVFLTIDIYAGKFLHKNNENGVFQIGLLIIIIIIIII